ncbi:MAG: ThiF family adenylyltransferase [Gloeocapsa sp. DLM2.Bin57]|nr:MAG: ThiF family adenylyltransferase [Gloeocapsa sp. DLM2.Bin57]
MNRRDTKFQLKRSLSIKFDQERPIIWIGKLPPNAIKIEHPPFYLAKMLEILSEPHTFEDLWQKIKFEYPQCHHSELKDFFINLLKLGVISPQFTEGRYHRHQLYFDLFQISPEHYYQTLSSKTVGLIGSGGIGSTAALLLTTAGVGTLILSDEDFLEESNLTRTILFEESDIGTRKVISAKARLESRNQETTIIPVMKMCDGVDFLKEYFSQCDVMLVSADSPSEIHLWVNQAAVELKIPYITAGYVEIFGSVGPFIVPDMTACYNCHLLDTKQIPKRFRQLNHNFQTASYGPLNGLVASIVVNEILRYLLNLETKTLGMQMLINFSDYTMSFIEYKKNSKCYCQQLNN